MWAKQLVCALSRLPGVLGRAHRLAKGCRHSGQVRREASRERTPSARPSSGRNGSTMKMFSSVTYVVVLVWCSLVFIGRVDVRIACAHAVYVCLPERNGQYSQKPAGERQSPAPPRERFDHPRSEKHHAGGAQEEACRCEQKRCRFAQSCRRCPSFQRPMRSLRLPRRREVRQTAGQKRK